jgi:hypothetical protein
MIVDIVPGPAKDPRSHVGSLLGFLGKPEPAEQVTAVLKFGFSSHSTSTR